MTNTPAQAWTDDNAIINWWREVFGEYPDVGQLAFVRTMRDDLNAEHERLQLELIAQFAAEDKRLRAIIAHLQAELETCSKLLHAEANNFETVAEDSNRIVEIGIEVRAENARFRAAIAQQESDLDTASQCVNELEAKVEALQLERIGWNHATDTQDEYIDSLEAELAALQAGRYVPVENGEFDAEPRKRIEIKNGKLAVIAHPGDPKKGYVIDSILPADIRLCRLQPMSCKEAQDAPQEAHSDGTND